MSECHPMLNKCIAFPQPMWSVRLRRAFWNVSFSPLALFRGLGSAIFEDNTKTNKVSPNAKNSTHEVVSCHARLFYTSCPPSISPESQPEFFSSIFKPDDLTTTAFHHLLVIH